MCKVKNAKYLSQLIFPFFFVLCRHCPKAHLLIISNPVNSTVPIAYETMVKHGVPKPSVFGITTLDLVRARTFVSEHLSGQDESQIDSVKVIGGHSGITIIPLIEKALPKTLSTDAISQLISRIRYGGDEVVKAKAGGGSATLSMAYAGYEFFKDFIQNALHEGRKAKPLVAYVKTTGSAYPTDYFATEIEANVRDGLKTILPMPTLTENERKMLTEATSELQKDIAKGQSFVASVQSHPS